MTRPRPHDPEARSPGDTHEALERDDARFVAQLRGAFAPEPRDAASQAAFVARLRERMDAEADPSRARGARWAWRLAPALAGFALALGLLAVLPEGPTAPPATTDPAPAATAAGLSASARAERLAWEESLFFPASAESLRDADSLPGEYEAIAVAFLGEAP